MIEFLKHPLTRHLALDDPTTTLLRHAIVREKGFLRKIYEEWYEWIASVVPVGTSPVLELGSGAGFLDEHIPGLVTSEVFFNPGVRVVLDGVALPFTDASLKAIAMVDVFHHIPDTRAFLSEAARCIKPGGRLLMVEPWVTPWSRVVYSRLHHEPFDPGALDWRFPAAGPLSSANSALPWIVFERDRSAFASAFPEFAIAEITVERPLTYLLSGGVSLRSLMPGFSYAFWRTLEKLLTPVDRALGMFAKISLERL